MNGTLTSENKRLIKEGIRREYAKAAVSPEGLFEYRTGRAGLEALDYGQEIIQALPDTVKASFCGVGNPFKLGHIKEAETVLDIGSGGGVDVFIAAKMVGPGGKAVERGKTFGSCFLIMPVSIKPLPRICLFRTKLSMLLSPAECSTLSLTKLGPCPKCCGF
jgi:hypothetical protein